MTTGDEDQRQHPRYAIELDAELRANGLRAVGRTHDISRGGFCLQSSQAITAGASCTVKLALVFSENQFSEQLNLPATIAWCTPVNGSYQIGVKFSDLNPQDISYLDLFIRFLDEGQEEEEEDPLPAAKDGDDFV